MSDRETSSGLSVDPELLASGLVHELRQPLMAIDAAGALLERALGDALARNPDWSLLRAQAARIAEILRGYEELMSPGEAEPRAFAVVPVVARAVELLAHRVRPLARRFAFRRDAVQLAGFGAPGAVIHATTNLLANACDAVEDAGGDARIEIRVLEVPRGVEVRVSDDGQGVAPELRARLFEPRFTTKPPGKGSGLGLHVARQLMSHYGGDVYLVRDDDRARLPWAKTEFCVALPAPPEGRG
ncbi:MAG TPA: HAMP domain-containing sensor histidine kinase [Anaeromyxobacteraceae bacterium]|nr:HAMP domain-containing sensor histidine kinase [Anaeromyxobacteraceae bacterium]